MSMQTSYTAQGDAGDKEFRYVQGDFPSGTRAQRSGSEVFLGLPARWWLFRYTRWMPLKGNVAKVEIIQPTPQPEVLPPLRPQRSSSSSQTRRFSGASLKTNRNFAAATQWATQVSMTVVNDVVSTVSNAISESGLFDNRQVIYTCTLKDGRSFIAQSTMKHYRWLVNETLLYQSVTRFSNFEFADATMAACALMAFVDGEVSPKETQQVEATLASHDILRQLAPEELKGRFTFYCDIMRHNGQQGYEAAIAAIKKLAGKEEQARALVHIMIDIGQTNEYFGNNQENCVRNVCGALGIYPGEFGLYYTQE